MASNNVNNHSRVHDVYTTHLVRIASLCIIIQVLILGGNTPGAALDLSLTCLDADTTYSDLRIKCTLKNTLDQDVFVLTRGIALEGPRNNFDDYIYLFVAGERYENVLQYHRAGIDLDRLPILFEPSIQPTLDDLENLRRLNSGDQLPIHVYWNFGTDAPFLSQNRWVLRVKIVYVSAESLLELSKSEDVIERCKKSVEIARSAGAKTDALQLVAFHPVRGTKASYYGCTDVISRAFVHLFSNVVKFSVP